MNNSELVPVSREIPIGSRNPGQSLQALYFLNYSFLVHQKSVRVFLGVVKMKKRDMGHVTEVASNKIWQRS